MKTDIFDAFTVIIAISAELFPQNISKMKFLTPI